VYLLGFLEVLPAFTGSFLTPVSILIYAILSAFLSAKFSTRSRKKSDDIKYRVIRNAATGELLLPISEISTGDSICLSGGEYIPLSGDVVAGEAYVYENGALLEKKPATGRAGKKSCFVNAGSAVYAGNITVEVSSENKNHTQEEANGFDKNDIFSWTFIGAAGIGIVIFIIRFIAGNMLYLGTYEALLDNLVLVFAVISLSSPFCCSSDYLAKVFAKFHKITVNKSGAIHTVGMVNSIAVDAKLLYPFSEPSFYAVTSENSPEYKNISDIKLLPDPLKGLVADNIKSLCNCNSRSENTDSDMQSLRRFAGLEDSGNENVTLLTEIPFLPENGFTASTFRKGGVIATEYCGKPDFFTKSYILGETGHEELTDIHCEKLTSAITLLSREGKRIRLLAVNHGRIKNGELPKNGWLILGYFVFPAVPTFAIKKAVNTTADGGIQISLLPTYESEIYDEYLITTLRLLGKYSPEKDSLTPDKKTASIVYDIASVLPESEVKIAPNAASFGVKKTADIVTNTNEYSDGFFDALDTIDRSKRFCSVYKLFGILTAILLITMFVFFAFVLRPLPVAFGDDIIPVLMFLSLLLGLSETLLLKNT
jgi:hypothetical protein